MATSSNDPIAPTALILPSKVDQSNTAPVGSITISGGKIWFATGTKWEVVTSA